MKSMLTAFAATLVIAVGADMVLETMGFSAQDASTGNAVRLDDSKE